MRALRRRAVRLVTILASLLVPAGAGAQWVSPGLSPEAVPALGIVLNDQAGDACWTNLGETRQYAGDQLRERGFRVAEDADYRLFITVNAARLAKSNACYGNIDLMMAGPARGRAPEGFHAVAFSSRIFMHSRNANETVIETIQSFGRMLDDLR